MTEERINSLALYTQALLEHYCFDLGSRGAEALVAHWMQQYPSHWVKLAVIEALYQGRYKAVSVEQLLNLWVRRGQASYHFNGDFERLIGRKLPQNLMHLCDAVADPGDEEWTQGYREPIAENWWQWEVVKRPIHQFVPPPDDSDFYVRLKAVAQQEAEAPPDSRSPDDLN